MASSIDVISQIKDCISHMNNFVLNGGAGSGKTYSLVETINEIYKTNYNARVACITYTNVAAVEIKKRVLNKKLWVSTIHDFLWDSIKSYQVNIKETLMKLLEENELKLNTSAQLETIDWNKISQIEYREYRKLQEGIISHNDILKISVYMMKNYPLLKRIVADKYQYLFIDEYQDADKNVIDVFLNHIKTKNNIIGLFGDHMQSIYATGIGNVTEYINQKKLVNIVKEDNFRCSIAVIDLINKLRSDGIKQKPAKKDQNGILLNKKGGIFFLYSNNPNTSITTLKKSKIFHEWDFNNTEKTKELYLTHRLIASQNKFEKLFAIFKDYGQESLIGDDKDKLLKYLLRIQEIVELYTNKKYNDVIKLTDLKIKFLRDKVILKEKIQNLIENYNSNIEKVIGIANSNGLAKVNNDNLFRYFNKGTEERNKYFELFENLKAIDFQEIVNFYNYDRDTSIYSTQHGVKGAEFENVLIVLDNGKWNQYNFESIFTEKGSENVINRTKKIFYVACSRAENNLVVYFNNPSTEVLKKANEWFGNKNVISI